LSPSQLEDLGWSEYGNSHYKVDRAALAVYQKLQDMGVSCRKRIYPGAARTIYHTTWITADVAEGFWKAGFREVDEYDHNGITPLLMIAHGSEAHSSREVPSTILWFLQHGAKNIVYRYLKKNTLIHRLAIRMGIGWPKMGKQIIERLPKILQLSMDCLSTYPEDDCVCYCSCAGCSPVTALIKHMLRRYWKWNGADKEIYTWWDSKQALFREWIRSCPASLCGRRAFYDLCRVEIFERLGMRHTCCKFMGWDLETVDALEAEEFREEDKHSKVKLDRLLELYDELERKYTSEFEGFWKIWWVDLENFVPMEVFSDGGRGTRIWPDETLPLPFDSLDESIANIREHVIRSMALSRLDVS
jgi:hypothetical protein